MKTIEVSEHDYEYINKLAQSIFAIYTRPGISYENDQDWIEEDVNEIKQQIGDYIFDYLLTVDQIDQINMITDPPEPEPEPIPTPANDDEILVFCRQCSRPTIYRLDPNDPMISYCATCGKKRIAISPPAKQK